MFDINNFVRLYFEKYKWHLIRFGLVGVATFFLNISLIWLLYENVGLDNRISVSGAYIITVAAHFLLNHSFTFRQKVETVRLDFMKYAIMVTFNYMITLIVSIVVVELFGLSIYLGGIFSVFVTGFTSFLLMNHFVFAGKFGKK